MDQDIHFQTQITWAAGAVTHYMRVPYRSTLRDVVALAQTDPGDAQTITITTEPTVGGTAVALGVVAFGATSSDGAVGTWTTDATTGDHVLEAGEFVVMTTTAGTAAQVDVDIEFDPYAR